MDIGTIACTEYDRFDELKTYDLSSGFPAILPVTKNIFENKSDEYLFNYFTVQLIIGV